MNDPVMLDPNEILAAYKERAAVDYAQHLDEIARLNVYVTQLLKENAELRRAQADAWGDKT